MSNLIIQFFPQDILRMCVCIGVDQHTSLGGVAHIYACIYNFVKMNIGYKFKVTWKENAPNPLAPSLLIYFLGHNL
jgi:hypothetical protein